jgi:hypothetical protein
MAQDDNYIENPIDGRPLTRPPRSFVAIILIIITIIILSYWLSGKKDLRRYGVMTTAKVTKWTSENNTDRVFEYVFTLDNKQQVSVKKYVDLSDVEADSLVNKTFPLIVISNNADNNDILINKKDFEKYKITQPDTLKMYDRLFTN